MFDLEVALTILLNVRASLYVETNLSSNHIAKLCYTLITKMGYQKTALTFETEQ